MWHGLRLEEQRAGDVAIDVAVLVEERGDVDRHVARRLHAIAELVRVELLRWQVRVRHQRRNDQRTGGRLERTRVETSVVVEPRWRAHRARCGRPYRGVAARRIE